MRKRLSERRRQQPEAARKMPGTYAHATDAVNVYMETAPSICQYMDKTRLRLPFLQWLLNREKIVHFCNGS